MPLEYKLKNGDIVEIVTNKSNSGPSRDWLETVAALREGVKEQLATARDREAFWRRALNPEILELVRTGHLLEAKEQVIHAAHLSGAES